MTNNWADIGNSTLVIAMGANPSENHPACMAHINNARTGPRTYYDRAGNAYTSAKPAAKLVVIDPRKTRTALQADMYVRIRPGTDIAFVNGLLNYIIDAQGNGAGLKAAANVNNWTRFKAFHEATANKNHFPDGVNTATAITGRPKYTDATIKVSGTDYARATFTQGANTISAFPVVATTGMEEAGTVYSNLKAHVAPYTPDVVAGICGCTADELTAVADLMIANSRCSSVVSDSDAYTATVNDPKSAGFRSTTMLYAMGITQHTCGSQNVKSFAVIQTLLGNMGRCGGGINALRGIHNVQGSTDMGLLYGNIPAYGSNPTAAQSFGGYMNSQYGNRLNGAAGSGATDPYVFTNGGLQQKGFYSMTKAWFGDSSFRGTWNPAYAETASAVTDGQANMDGLYSLWPKGNGDNHIKMLMKMLPTYAAADKITAAVVWGQNPAITEPNQAKVRAALKELDLLVCVDMFANETALCDRKEIVGANPAGVTYLLPACSHVEEAGSATNSGRVLQWRYQAVSPLGNSKTDMELLLRFAKALDGANAFAHIKSVWNTLGVLGGNSADAWAMLYGNQYGWTWGGTFNSEAVASKVYKQMCAPQNFGGTIWIYLDAWDVTTAISQSWSPTAGTPTVTLGGANLPPTVLNGATPVTDWTFNNNTAILTAGASLYGLTLTVNWDKFSSANARGAEWPSTIVISGVSAAYDGNRAKSRVKVDAGAGGVGSGNLLYKNWGYSWLVNRRVFYNNSDVPGDQADGFQGPELVSRMYTSTSTATIDYSTAYRTIHRLTDVPKLPGNTTPAQAPMAGRFPHHTEPYETPREDLAAYWGYNTVSNTALTPGAAATGERNLVPIDTPIGTKATYPLVLTTIRCVEHFQGGPITRNNWANVDLEPVPWVELNSTDARAAGIKDGDPVRIVTARTESFGANHTIEQSFPRALYGQGFVARVGTGLPAGQKIGAGVVAIPWHWGEAGLATGSRANDLCIDAMDANTTIPESKACLCRIEKM